MAKALPIHGIDPDGPILASACNIIEMRLGEMLRYEPYIADETRVYELHQMRIAAKRLRYSMEIFQPLYRDFSQCFVQFEEATDQIKALQEHLGEIHDSDVLVPKLEEHITRLLKAGHGRDKKGELRTGVDLVDLDACQGLLSVCMQVRDERTDRYRLLCGDWKRIRENGFFESLLLLLRRAAQTGRMPEGKDRTV